MTTAVASSAPFYKLLICQADRRVRPV